MATHSSPLPHPYLTLTSLSFRVSELRREVVPSTKWEASSSEVDVDSIAASISRLRVGSGTVRETFKSHYSRRIRRVARSELAALLTALLSSSITHRFCWVSSLFQRDVCFVIDSTTSKGRLEPRKATTKTLTQADDHVLSSTRYCIAYVLRVYTYVTKNAM